MKNILNFLENIRQNNNKEWFDAHKSEYKAIQPKVERLTEDMISYISLWDKDIAELKPSDCLYRINRDIRFSKNKTPYKEHIGIYIAKSGKKGGYAGYYFHIEPDGSQNGKHLLAAGTYMLENKYLKAVREDIYARYDEFYRLLRSAPAFILDRTNCLKRVPHGFPNDKKYEKYLTLKDYCLIKPFEQNNLLVPPLVMFDPTKTTDIIESGTLAHYLAEQMQPTRRFVAFINRAIDFVREQGEESVTW